MNCYDIIIVGGGLAGLTAALHLSQNKYAVLLIEKKEYPHHKVCGEYVSNEVIPYLNGLGVTFENLRPKAINTLLLSAVNGKSVQTKLPLGGTGISRFALDNLLYQKAIDSGVSFKFDSVSRITFENDIFEVVSEKEALYNAKLVIGAYGKRSALDKSLERPFIQQKSTWLGVKAHYEYEDFPDDLVALHNFNGGYGGLSKTETGAVNFCYLVSYDSFRKEKSIQNFNSKIIAKNPYLGEFLASANPIFKEPLTISQISFNTKSAVENHILMCGDTAGLIHPLCGNGMAMAIHAAKIASELICDYFEHEDRSRSQLEADYQTLWNKAFQKRLRTGRRLQSILLHKKVSNAAIELAIRTPFVLHRLIKNTHGKTL